MNVLSQRNVEKLLMIVSVLLVLIVGWLYIRGKKDFTQPPFQTVNDQMAQLIEVYDVNIDPSANPSVNPSVNPSAVPAAILSVDPSVTSSSNPHANSTDTLPTSEILATDASQININTATIEQLDTLPGIGQSKAKAIVDYRQSIGKFTSLQQLLEVKGIGDKLLAKLTPHIVVSTN